MQHTTIIKWFFSKFHDGVEFFLYRKGEFCWNFWTQTKFGHSLKQSLVHPEVNVRRLDGIDPEVTSHEKRIVSQGFLQG